MSEMKTLDERQQLMVILMEECGELIQECSKNLRRSEIFDRQKFKDEVGDVYAMIDLLVEWDILSWTEIEKRREEKREKLKKQERLDMTRRKMSEEQRKKTAETSESCKREKVERKSTEVCEYSSECSCKTR